MSAKGHGSVYDIVKLLALFGLTPRELTRAGNLQPTQNLRPFSRGFRCCLVPNT